MGKLILASASPRRKELLSLTGLPFTVIPGNGEEVIHTSDPAEAVEALSREKAEAVCGRAGEEDVIIGADTVVALDSLILGKPAGEEEAFSMLKRLQGREHAVYTGVTVLEKGKPLERVTFSEKTTVHVLPMTDEEILDYIATGEPMDKAGAYGIQGRFAVYVRGIEGDYQNVVGLPVSRLYGFLRKYKENLND
ncbi:Maf family protein [Lacrimispora sp. NSJ-141]|uniref:dTTP/UTP pyrophosphatase n=1 Tax=Lientehia hominis TaxID=2897778 RepID=A0AAP2RI99_9FIRM|nr:Maf family protein [Lientehia hominis]MCD2492376.1 Maf family protein [Lientehia hominis]